MDDFEQQLKRALARKDAPGFFEAKVLAAANRQQTGEMRVTRFVRPWSRWITAGAATVLMISGVVWQRERNDRERVAGESAKAQLELALKITSKKLKHIELQIENVQQGN